MGTGREGGGNKEEIRWELGGKEVGTGRERGGEREGRRQEQGGK